LSFGGQLSAFFSAAAWFAALLVTDADCSVLSAGFVVESPFESSLGLVVVSSVGAGEGDAVAAGGSGATR